MLSSGNNDGELETNSVMSESEHTCVHRLSKVVCASSAETPAV